MKNNINWKSKIKWKGYKLLLIVSVLFLVGCISPEKIEQRELARRAAGMGMTVEEYQQWKQEARTKIMERRARERAYVPHSSNNWSGLWYKRHRPTPFLNR